MHLRIFFLSSGLCFLFFSLTFSLQSIFFRNSLFLVFRNDSEIGRPLYSSHINLYLFSFTFFSLTSLFQSHLSQYAAFFNSTNGTEYSIFLDSNIYVLHVRYSTKKHTKNQKSLMHQTQDGAFFDAFHPSPSSFLPFLFPTLLSLSLSFLFFLLPSRTYYNFEPLFSQPGTLTDYP